MKFLALLLVVAAVVVLAVWFLPWWATLGLVVLVVAPIAWFGWKIIRTIKKEIVPALKRVGEGMPRAQERLCSLPAGEPFRGNGFAFAFPVPCEVSQMVIDDLEALLLKPALNDSTTPATGLIVVSTMARDELKTRITDQLDTVFDQVKAGLAQQGRPGDELQTEEFQPTQVGSFRGEYRQFWAANKDKKIRGETVYLGEQTFSVAWALIGPEEGFDKAAESFRRIAGSIKRISEQPTIDVTSVENC